MRICCAADLHGTLPEIPPCDLLLLAGDLVPLGAHAPRDGRRWLDGTFRAWLDALPARTRVVGVAGNHDFVFQEGEVAFDPPLRWTYLQDSEATVAGLRIWGTPWQPRFFDWAFNLDEPELAEKWAAIPDGLDVLLLHGPPFGYGDPRRGGPSARRASWSGSGKSGPGWRSRGTSTPATGSTRSARPPSWAPRSWTRTTALGTGPSCSTSRPGGWTWWTSGPFEPRRPLPYNASRTFNPAPAPGAGESLESP